MKHRAWTLLNSEVDPGELGVLVGLAMLWYGLYLRDPSMSYIVIGSIVFIFSVLSFKRT